MKNKTLKCKCGSTLFVRNLRVSGWQMQIIDSVTSEITYTNRFATLNRKQSHAVSAAGRIRICFTDCNNEKGIGANSYALLF